MNRLNFMRLYTTISGISFEAISKLHWLRTSAIFLIGFALLAPNASRAQTSTTVWEATSVKYDDLAEEKPLDSQFIFDSNQHVQWVQGNGGHTYDFEITETLGVWANKAQDGALTYKVKNTHLKGEIVTERKAGALLVHMKMIGKNNRTNSLTCKVNTITSR